TNSSRAAMLIRLIISPADEHRAGANQMRQHLSFREHFRRGNAVSHPVCRAARRARSKRHETPAQNVWKSQQYDYLVSPNAAFRSSRMRKECGPIRDPAIAASRHLALMSQCVDAIG